MTVRQTIRSIVLAALLLAAAAGPASAGTYTVTSCPNGYGINPNLTPNAFLQTYRASVNDRCSSSQGFGLGLGGPDILDAETVNGTVGFQIAVPAAAPNTTLRSARFTLTIAGKTGDADSTGAMSWSANQPDTNRAALATWPAGRTTQIGPAPYTVNPGSGVRKVYVSASCVSRCVFDELPNAAGNFLVDQVVLTLDDSTAPAPATVGGLPTGTVAYGSQLPLSITAADADSGVAQVDVFLAGRAVGQSKPTNCIAVTAAVCPQTSTVSMPLQLGSETGVQQFTVVTTDYAGNTSTSLSAPFTIGPPPAAALPENGEPRGTPTITAKRKGTKAAGHATATVTYGRAVILEGRVLSADGQAMAGVHLDVSQTVAGQGAAHAADLTTDAKGAYRYVATPATATTYTLRFPGVVGGFDWVGAPRTVAVSVRAAVSLTRRGPTRRGSTTVFSGKVRAATIPKGGVRVVLQYHSSSGWQDIKVLRTTGKGAFSWGHRFGIAATYRFRARVLSDPGLPAKPGTSSVVSVRIR
ncbi:MAG: hypothetical protein REI11_10435 [Patulibacter sp.]|nr:hypothetical protein [Patulibacter sp.]